MAENNIQIELDLITKAFDTALREAVKDVDGFGKAFAKAEDGASKSLGKVGASGKEAGKDVAEGAKQGAGAWDVFKGVLGAEAIVGAFGAITGAAKSLFNTFVVEGVAGALEAEASLIKLTSALEVSGDATNGTLEDFQNFASQLQKNTQADGDAVLSQLALAKQYGLTNEQAKQVVTTATDMAARGYDADASVRQLSESFSGQAGKLAKLNPAIRELTEEQIKAGAALEIISGQFNGSAANSVKTFSGATDQAKNAFGDLQEEIGFLITKNPALISAIQQAVGLFQQMTAYVAANSDSIKDLITNGIGALVSSMKFAVEAGTALIRFITENQVGLQAVAVGLGVAATAFGAYALAMNAGAIATGIASAAQTALNIVMSANPIGLVVVALGALAAGIYYAAQNWDLITAATAGFAGAALQNVIPAINAILDVIRPLVAVFSEEMAASIDAAKATVAAKAEELLAFQADSDARLEAQKQAARDLTKLNEDAANAGKTAGAKLQTEEEAANEKAAQLAKNQAKTQALLLEAEQQKASDEAKKANDKLTKDALAKADKEAAAEKAKLDKLDKEEARNRERSLTDAIKAEYGSRTSFAAASDREKVANFRSTMGEIASLQNSSSKELFAVGKAAALTNAVLNTYAAANVALASSPPPFNFALAAAVTAAGLINVQKISTAKPPSAGSFQDGGIVGGSSFTGDRMTANVNSREAIFTLQQQKRLYSMATGEGGGGGESVTSAIDGLKAAILGQPIIVQIDGEAVATAVRTQVRGGFALGSS